MRHNGRENQELGDILRRAGVGTKFSVDEVPYEVVETLAAQGLFGWVVGSYRVKNGEERTLYPDLMVNSVKVLRRVFPEDAGWFEKFHTTLMDRRWH